MEHRHHFRTDVPYEARCVMRLPEDAELAGLRVVDAWCRRGKGAFLIADRVGRGGAVVGVEPDAASVAAAREGALRARTDAWPPDVRFVCAQPARMVEAGVAPGSADLVVANAALNCAPSVPEALRAFARVLAPGGRLWLDALVRVGDGPAGGVAGLPGSVFACAPTWDELRDMLAQAGFARVTVADRAPERPLGPDDAEGLAGVAFERGIVTARV